MNSSFPTLFWTQFWQVTLLIPAAVLLIRYVIPKSPHLGYGILLLVLVKTLFPPVWDSPTGIVWELVPKLESRNVTEPVTTHLSVRETTTAAASNQTNPELIQNSPSTEKAELAVEQSTLQSQQVPGLSSASLNFVIIGVWFAGVLSLLGYIVGKRAQLLRFHRDTEIAASDELLELVKVVSAELGLVKIPKVLVTLHPTVPFASGFLKQIVVLPSHVAQKADRQELKLILAHEMTHLRRGDTLVGLLQLVVQVIWWFHPLVYWLNREVRRVREECCDTDVVRRLNCQPARYAHCLLNMLELHQSLRPATELVGLSPLEVTKKRMQNIMRIRPKGRQTLPAIFSTVMLVTFALLILPASANSFVTPKVILGDLVPEDALVAERLPEAEHRTRPSPPPENRKKRKKAPPASPAQDNPTQQPSNVIPPADREKESNNDPLRLAASLEYSWIRGDQHKYRVTLVAKHPTEVIRFIGEPIFRVDAYAGGKPALSRLNPKFDRNVTAVSGAEIPTLAELEPNDDLTPSIPYSPITRYPFGPPGRSNRSESSRPDGSNGHIDPSTGSLPYFLGTLQDWVFPQLPLSLDKTTEINFEREIKLTAPGTLTFSPFETPAEEKLVVDVEIKTAVHQISEEDAKLTRSWHLVSQNRVNNEPRREITLDGTMSLNQHDSFINHASYAGKLVEREFNREYRIPLTIEIERVNQ